MSIEQISNWFGKVFPNPGPRNITTQLGVHFEEVAEMLGTLRGGGQEADERLKALATTIEAFGNDLKAGRISVVVDDEVEMLDSLCDQVVTAIGVGHLHGMDVVGAIKEVADSNDSKFGEDGMPIFDENLKVRKGPSYFRPDLARFLRRENGPTPE